ncbi:MAG: hypothetical protein ACFCGT_15400 [Sandaracinaceae bacterium]
MAGSEHAERVGRRRCRALALPLVAALALGAMLLPVPLRSQDGEAETLLVQLRRDLVEEVPSGADALAAVDLAGTALGSPYAVDPEVLHASGEPYRIGRSPGEFTRGRLLAFVAADRSLHLLVPIGLRAAGRDSAAEALASAPPSLTDEALFGLADRAEAEARRLRTLEEAAETRVERLRMRRARLAAHHGYAATRPLTRTRTPPPSRVMRLVAETAGFVALLDEPAAVGAARGLVVEVAELARRVALASE